MYLIRELAFASRLGKFRSNTDASSVAPPPRPPRPPRPSPMTAGAAPAAPAAGADAVGGAAGTGAGAAGAAVGAAAGRGHMTNAPLNEPIHANLSRLLSP